MPRAAGPEEGPRQRAPEALPRSQERRRLFAHLRSRSFSDFEFALEDDGNGSGGDGRRQQQQQRLQHQHRSQGQNHRPPNQPRVVDVGCRGVGVGFARGRSFSYCRLPEHQLRLTIMKLDCSSFDVQVMKSASVLELKLAVEDIFYRPPKGEGAISWSLVWSHFCLCYKDQKLIDDKVPLKAFGIKDGDELHFIRHASINYNPIKRHPRKHGRLKMELTGSEVHQESEKDAIDNDGIKMADDCSNHVDTHCDNKYGDLIPPAAFKPAHSLRGWLSYSGSWSSVRAMLGTTVRPSRLDGHCPKADKR